MRIIISFLVAIVYAGFLSAQTNTAVTKRPGEQYEIVGKLSGKGVALVRLRGKYGFIDKEGKEVVPLIYDDIEDETKESGWYKTCMFLAVKRNQKWGLIDSNHNIIAPCVYDKIENFYESQYMHWAKRDGKYGTIDQAGNIAIPFEYEDIQHYFFLEDKGSPIYVKKQGKYGYVDEKNNILIPFKYSTAKMFGSKNKFAPVSINGKYGFINMVGEEVIPLQYDFSENYYSGLAAVVKNGKAGFIDTKGEVVIPFKYTPNYASEGNSKEFEFNFEPAGVALVKKGAKWGLINKRGDELTEFKYDSYQILSTNGDFTLGINGKKVYLDKWGNEYNTKEQREAGRKTHLIIDAQAGNALAQYELGNLYFYAKDSEKDVEKAFELYYKAAMQGLEEAFFNVAYMYGQGEGTSKNQNEAFKWYQKSAEYGNMVGQYNLGLYYQYGYGPIKDIDKALYWYRKSAEQGYEHAKERLSELNWDNKPSPTPVNKLASLTWLTYEPITKQKDYSFKIGVKSDSKIEDINVYVNGTLSRGIIPVLNDGYNMTIDRTVALNDGQNDIKVMVKNAGGTASIEKTVTYQNQSVATIDWLSFSPTTTEKQFALKVGVKSTSKIESWTISVNDMVDRGINPVKNDGYTLTIDKMLSLTEGNNTVKIEVRNADGLATAEKSVTYSPKRINSMVQQRRIALVMGNANYRDADKRLKNPVNDATDIAAKLEHLGFTVIRSIDQTQQGMETAINNFGNLAKKL